MLKNILQFFLIMKIQRFLIAFIGALLTTSVWAQTTPPPPKTDHSYKPLTLKLNEDGSKYVRFIMWHQFWLTATQNNPGTTDVNGKKMDGSDGADGAWTTDFALRRSRFLAYAQISPRCLILTHWGINNQSFINGGAGAGANVSSAGTSNAGKRPQMYIHDAWTEFEVLKNKLYLGAGLHYWNGVSRLGSQSTLNFMTMDAPIFNWQNIEFTDQFARQYGIYAKGQLGRLDYRFAINKPFASGLTPLAISTNGVAANVLNENWAQAGYVNWMFWDKENNKLPFYVGSHLGAKKVFNVGAGFYRHGGASLYKSSDGRDSSFQDQIALGVDVYLDMPLNKEKGTSLSLYGVYYNFDYGTKYIRSIGILNLHPGPSNVESWSGPGNLQPTIGTGSIVYLQAGYQMPKLKNGTSFMPYVTLTHKDFDRLADPSTQYGLGLNYFVTGHNAKLTLEYQTRPIYKLDGADVKRDGYRGEFILQTHIFL
jgi:hypothetical protein